MLPLQLDHEQRPLWITQEGRIFMETFHSSSKHAQEFLVAIAEPISRPKHIHEYRLTEFSLYAAVSIGLDAETILKLLQKLCKSNVPLQVIEWIQKHAESYGKLKMVLKNNRYYLECLNETVLETCLADSVICESRVLGTVFQTSAVNLPNVDFDHILNPAPIPIQDDDYFDGIDDIDLFELFESDEPEVLVEQSIVHIEHALDSAVVPDETEVATSRYSFEIQQEKVNEVKKRCSELKLPVLEEYDFHNDTLPPLQVDLKPFTKLRPYQEKCLSKIFGNARARSGIIVLPCGAGKTLVGITAACTIKKSCLVLCTSNVSVEQWAREFKHWSTAKDGQVARFTSEHKETFSGTGIMISTYTMITYSGKRAYDAQKLMDFILAQEFGFLLLDEVHVVPAEMFRKVFTIVAAHAKMGLTATLLREDNKIDNLNYLIGPKLFEANWMELARDGHIANVSCTEVWCDMPPEFFGEYLKEKSRKRQLLYTMNPRKIQACQYLVLFHESMGDKIIVFSDNVFALKHYATKLNKPYIFGGTSQAERIRVLQQFRFNPALNTIFISKVGDTSIDLPEANVLIQISSQFGSRRQEAQRLGRILRPKAGSVKGSVNAYFYTLVSKDTEEMYFATKRQRFLVDQGYEFKIVTNLEGVDTIPDPVYTTLTERIELLNTVLLSSEKDWEDAELLSDQTFSKRELVRMEEEEDEDDELPIIRRVTTSLQSLSGGDSMAYLEFNRGSSSGLEGGATKRSYR